MPNDYYERQSQMDPGGLADGLAMEQEFDAISRAFGKLPKPHREGGGFEGPTKVGEPIEGGHAVNLHSLEKLNLPIYRKKITTEDWNTITTAGIYDVSGATGPNKPPVYNYGVLNVYVFNGVVMQVYYPDTNDSGFLCKRSSQNIESGTWLAWGVVVANSSACLVNAIGTGAPNELVSPAIPANIINNTRYVLPNPFGVNVPVSCIVEILANGKWAEPGWEYTGPSGVYGVKAGYVQGEGIIIQTAKNYVLGAASDIGGLGGGTGALTSAPCRVFINKD